MNNSLKKLLDIAIKPNRRIIGLMSGTSMDGLDIAVCRISGSGKNTGFEVEQFTTVFYPADVNHQLLAFANSKCLDPQLLCVWHTQLAHIHAGYVNKVLSTWGISSEHVDLIASHGQTIYHAPRHKHGMAGFPHATLQIGDGDHMAMQTGITTVSDFRQRDTARGNEGAPLAGYGDYLLFGNSDTHRILLNIGGISNFTWLPAGSGEFPPLSCDTGPGNILIDAATRKHYEGLQFDKGGGLAARGKINYELLNILKQHPYFGRPAPKTTGFEVFHIDWVEECISAHNVSLHAEDLLATLTRLTVETITDHIRKVIPEGETVEIVVSGGGTYNNTLMASLANALAPFPVKTMNNYGVSSDAKEALLFAVLANELICGEDTRFHLGKISFPDL